MKTRWSISLPMSAALLFSTSALAAELEPCENHSASAIAVFTAPNGYHLTTEPTNLTGAVSTTGRILAVVQDLSTGLQGRRATGDSPWGTTFFNFEEDFLLPVEDEWQAVVRFTDISTGEVIDSYCKRFNVQKPPVANSISVSGALVNGSLITLTGSGTISPYSARGEDGLAPSYRWELEDGTTQNGKTITHTFSEPGTYAVKMKVYDGTYWSPWKSRTLQIGQSSTVLSKVTNVRVTHYACRGGVVQLKVSWDPGGGNPTQYSYRTSTSSTWITTTSEYFYYMPPPGQVTKWYIRAGNGTEWSEAVTQYTQGYACDGGTGPIP